MSNRQVWNQYPRQQATTPEVPKWPKKTIAIVVASALGIGGIGAALVIHNKDGSPKANTTVSSAAPSGFATPSTSAESSTITPSTSPSVINSPSHTSTPVSTEQPSSSTRHYPKVGSLQGKVGYITQTDQTGILWGKAVLSSDTNFIDLSCSKTYPEANLVVVTVDDAVRKTYPTYGYPDAAREFCDGTNVRLGSISGAYSTLLAAALTNAGISRATSSPS